MQISKNDICNQRKKLKSFNQINFLYIIPSAGNKGVPTCSKAARASGFDTQEVTFYVYVSCTNYIISLLVLKHKIIDTLAMYRNRVSQLSHCWA
jgi:hypothetical protein